MATSCSPLSLPRGFHTLYSCPHCKLPIRLTGWPFQPPPTGSCPTCGTSFLPPSPPPGYLCILRPTFQCWVCGEYSMLNECDSNGGDPGGDGDDDDNGDGARDEETPKCGRCGWVVEPGVVKVSWMKISGASRKMHGHDAKEQIRRHRIGEKCEVRGCCGQGDGPGRHIWMTRRWVDVDMDVVEEEGDMGEREVKEAKEEVEEDSDGLGRVAVVVN